MAKKVDRTEVNMAPAPRFNTRADIASGLNGFLKEIMSCCGQTFELTFARSAENITQQALDKLEKNVKNYAEADTGLVAVALNPVTSKKERTHVKVGMIEMWINTFPPLAKAFQNAGILLTMLVRYGVENTSIINDRATIRADTCTQATMLLQSPTTKYSYETTSLLTRYRCRSVTEIDKQFLYCHLRKNGAPGHEVLYWMTPEGAILVPRAEKTGEIPIGDYEFWNAFYNENDENIKDIIKAIEQTIYNYEDKRPLNKDGSGMPVPLDDSLLAIAPQCMLSNAVLTKRVRKEIDDEGKVVEKFDCYMIEFSRGINDRSQKRDVLQSILSQTLVKNLVMSEVAYAPQFSNTPGASLIAIPLSGETASGEPWVVDAMGCAGKAAAERGDSAPELPSEFRRFFFGERGDMCIFQSDPHMSQLRLADFMYRVLVEKTQCRQCLTLAGVGKDGKSVLIKIINAVLGFAVATINAERLDDPAVTYSVINKPLVVMPEVRYPSQIFRSSFFKQLTGGDTMPLRQLYHMPIDWTPEHSRLMMTTNYAVYLTGDAQVSRCLPIAMRKAYDPRTAREENDIIASCLTQKIEFLQWICDTRAYYRALRTKKGDATGLFLPDRLMIVTDEDFDAILSDELSLLDSSERERRMIERRAMESTGIGRFFVSYGEEASEDEVEWYERLFNTILEPDPEERVLRADLTKAIMSAAEIDSRTKQPRCPEAKFAIDALGMSMNHILRDKAFIAFKNWLESEGKVTLIKPKGQYFYKGVRLKALAPTATTTVTSDDF